MPPAEIVTPCKISYHAVVIRNDDSGSIFGGVVNQAIAFLKWFLRGIEQITVFINDQIPASFWSVFL